MLNNKEITTQAQTVDQAIEMALVELKATREQCKIDIIEQPKKSLFGKIKGQAVVKVTVVAKNDSLNKLDVAVEYLTEIIKSMGLENVSINVKEQQTSAVISLEGEGVGAVIGHHGETLDALQYLVALATNRVDGDYFRITLDGGNYREKRENTLRELAKRIAAKVKKTGRSQMLESMNPYERRIIHAVVSEIEGVSSKSKGEEPNRRVIILSDKPAPRTNKPRPAYNKPVANSKPERTMEDILKNDFKDKEKSAELYSKIEF